MAEDLGCSFRQDVRLWGVGPWLGAVSASEPQLSCDHPPRRSILWKPTVLHLVSCPPHCCHYFISNSAFKVKRDYKTNGVGGIVLRKPGRRLGRLVFLGFREGVGGDGADEKWHWP